MRYPDYQTIDIQMDGSVCIVSMNKPEIRNALMEEMREELKHFFLAAGDDCSIRSIVLAARGEVFSAGGDLKALQHLNPKETKERMEKSQELIKSILRLQKPVLAVVHGAAAGAGFSLALSCDMIFAAKSSVFIQSFIKIGVVPDLGAMYFLPELVGRQKAMEMMLLGEKVSAHEMERVGVVNRVFEDNVVFDEALVAAKKMAENPRLSMGLIKKMANFNVLNELEQTFELEISSQCLCVESEDFKEGVQAFFEKRKAVYN
ncbi:MULTISPECIES: enoyl-CoA hydratase/isomerase family protein [Sporosarcina]|uniref:enoyl-CoA hydratase/isomerase family protein n=1 Tax=Sporosarcina TaxID=1569 RepID=UPI000A167C81|nr:MULTISPECIES: enoyl-CoA hydratase-related protein [Sporosarcina]ARJ37908.1 enoyl-CoA hydratase [Sporosarcina ureae]